MSLNVETGRRMPQWAALLGAYSGEDPEPERLHTSAGVPPTPAQGAAIYADELRQALKIVKAACPTTTAIRALSGVLIQIGDDGSWATCDNLEAACRVPLAGAGTVEILVSLTALQNTVDDAVGTVRIVVEDGQAIIRLQNQTTTVKLQQMRREDFPSQTFAGEKILSGDLQLADTVAAAAICAGKDFEKPILTGVRLDGEHNTILSTDSYRLFLTEMRCRWDGAITVPTQSFVKALRDADTFSLRLTVPPPGRPALLVIRPDRLWRIRLIEGQFPDSPRLIPEKWAGAATFDRRSMMRALGRVVKLLDSSSPVKLKFRSDNTIELSAVRPDVAEVHATIPARITDRASESDAEFGLNPRMLLEGLAICGRSEEIAIRFIHPLRPLMLVDGADRYLQMPMRLNK